MKECSKSIVRRCSNLNFVRKYFWGDGVDVGGRPDPLAMYGSLFPNMNSCKTWDIEDGDGQVLASIPDGSMDFVHSSHCLEHLVDPAEALKNWYRVLKFGGYLIVTVPDEDLYEQGVFPSLFNADHKWTFTIFKQKSWSKKSLNVLDLIKVLPLDCVPISIVLLDQMYRAELIGFDQTLTPVAESGIEFILRKGDERSHDKWIADKKFINRYVNQMLSDKNLLKAAAKKTPPFDDERDF